MSRISLEEQILDHLINALESQYGEEAIHYEKMFPLLAKYRARLDVIERRYKGVKNER